MFPLTSLIPFLLLLNLIAVFSKANQDTYALTVRLTFDSPASKDDTKPISYHQYAENVNFTKQEIDNKVVKNFTFKIYEDNLVDVKSETDCHIHPKKASKDMVEWGFYEDLPHVRTKAFNFLSSSDLARLYCPREASWLEAAFTDELTTIDTDNRP